MATKTTPKKRATKQTITWQLISPIQYTGNSTSGDVYHVSRRQNTNGELSWVTDVQISDYDATLSLEEAQAVAETDANREA